MKQIYFYIFSILSIASFSQSEKIIAGQLVCKDAILQGITILNLVNEKEAVSDFTGRFSIAAKVDDLLVIQSTNFEYARKIIDDEDFKKGIIAINLIKKIEQLEEVKIVNYSNINTVSLGIQKTTPKSYTPAERKLRTATALYAQANVGNMAGGSVGLDPLINAITGRTKMLKRNLSLDQTRRRAIKLSEMFSDSYFMNTLNIPEISVKAFQFYASDDPKVINGLALKNKFLVSFALISASEEFIKLQVK